MSVALTRLLLLTVSQLVNLHLAFTLISLSLELAD